MPDHGLGHCTYNQAWTLGTYWCYVQRYRIVQLRVLRKTECSLNTVHIQVVNELRSYLWCMVCESSFELTTALAMSEETTKACDRGTVFTPFLQQCDSLCIKTKTPLAYLKLLYHLGDKELHRGACIFSKETVDWLADVIYSYTFPCLLAQNFCERLDIQGLRYQRCVMRFSRITMTPTGWVPTGTFAGVRVSSMLSNPFWRILGWVLCGGPWRRVISASFAITLSPVGTPRIIFFFIPQFVFISWINNRMLSFSVSDNENAYDPTTSITSFDKLTSMQKLLYWKIPLLAKRHGGITEGEIVIAR